MGVGHGGNTSANSGGIGCIGVCLILLLAAAAIAIAITLLPFAGLWLAYRWWSRRPTTTWNMLVTSALVAGSIALAAWMWPQEYVAVRYSEDVPDVEGLSLSTAKEDLTERGFHHIQVVVTTGAAEKGDCQVTRQDPQSDTSKDTRQAVTLWVACSP